MDLDWRSLLVTPTPEIVRTQKVAGEAGAGILWSLEGSESLSLSAVGALAWDGSERKPSSAGYEWVGFNLLCNAAPTPFVLNGESFHSIDSFYEALKIPEGTPERAACAMSPLHEAQRIARRYHSKEFAYQQARIAVGSADHEALLATAITAKVDQHLEVQSALRGTGSARLVFPLTFSSEPGALARTTPLTLMIERWKRFGPQM